MPIVNVALLKHPANYFVVLLMLLLAGIGGHFLLKLGGFTPSMEAKDPTEKQPIDG